MRRTCSSTMRIDHSRLPMVRLLSRVVFDAAILQGDDALALRCDILVMGDDHHSGALVEGGTYGVEHQSGGGVIKLSVGSSARANGGLDANARAICTRCC